MANIAYLQSVAASAAATTTMTSSSTAGDVIIAAYAGTMAPTGISDQFGNTYQRVVGLIGTLSSGAVNSLYTYYAINVSTGTTINTITITASTATSILLGMEYTVPPTVMVNAAGGIYEVSTSVTATKTTINQGFASVFPSYFGTTTEIMGVLIANLHPQILATATEFTIATGNLRQQVQNGVGNFVAADYDVSTNTAINTITYTGATALTSADEWNITGVYISAINTISRSSTILLFENGWSGGMNG